MIPLRKPKQAVYVVVGSLIEDSTKRNDSRNLQRCYGGLPEKRRLVKCGKDGLAITGDGVTARYP
jgi:hypothetical protein